MGYKSKSAPRKARAGHSSDVSGVVGRIRVHPAGYGFVERDDGEADVFVPDRFRGTALDGDRVSLTTWLGHKGTEGRVVEVLERGRAKLTGLLGQKKHRLFLEPDDPRISETWGRVELEGSEVPARPGQCVVAEITRYPDDRGGTLVARVTHVLGDPDDPRTEVAKVLTVAGVPEEFPEDVLAAARRTPQELVASDFADRVDLRDRPFLTIDPETARDFDDAVYLEERDGGYRLWVAVADVSHYVQPGSALDREARVRGCSVYLPDRAIPMLPGELSSGICSLNPEVDRCAMVVRIDLDQRGVPQSEKFCAAVIRSHARLDYPGVGAALHGDFRGMRARYRDWAPDLARMNELARKMRQRRRERGALDFDLPEAKIVLDEDDPRLVRDVRRAKGSPEEKQAYEMIEEFMLAANMAVARYFQKNGHDCVWRIHDVPTLERLEDLAMWAESFGIDVDAERCQSPRGMQAILKAMEGKPYERALNFLVLRSLQQAAYDTVNVGHFALAAPEYLHFTSPIRRYPDLIVHRLLRHHLRAEGEPSGGREHAAPPPRDVLQEMAADASAHERRAQEVEREVVDMYRTFLMRDRIDEVLDGVISGVASFGVFVQCEDPFVEGMIRMESIGEERYDYDERRLEVVARRSGHTLRLGDDVKVKVVNVSVARRQVDLALVGQPRSARGQRTKGAGRRKGRRQR